MIILNFNFVEKFSEIENNSETTLDQGDCAQQNKQSKRSKSRFREQEYSYDTASLYKAIDNYIESIKTKGFGIFRYSDSQSFNSYEIYSIEDFYKSKVISNTKTLDQEKQDNPVEQSDSQSKYILMRLDELSKRWEASVFNIVELDKYSQAATLINSVLSRSPAGMHYEDKNLSVFRCKCCNSK